MQFPVDATASELAEILSQLGVIVAGDPTPQHLYDMLRAQGFTDEVIAAEVEEQRAR